jgi:ketosteroid isomerase-like protein
MMKGLLFCLLFLTGIQCYAQTADEKAIRNILNRQTAAWNNGNLEEFMSGYWKNDSLMFIGQSGITYGWNQTLANYKKHYPDSAIMGKLKFDIILVKPLSSQYYYVTGKWMLKRSAGDVSGYFTLLFRKINGTWIIIADHSS